MTATILTISVEAIEELKKRNVSPVSLIGEDGYLHGVFVKTVVDVTTIITLFSSESSGYLIIDLVHADIFSTTGSAESLCNRLQTATLSHLARSVSIPYSWSSYSWDADRRFLSFFAHSSAQGGGERVYLERNPRGSPHVFIYGIAQSAQPFESIFIDYGIYERACNAILDAVVAAQDDKTLTRDVVGKSAIDLSKAVWDISNAADYAEWYNSRLTIQQRDFVDKPLSRPVRLRGAAGTGKTLALCVKLMKDAERLNDENLEKRLLFIVQSSSNKERVLGTLEALDSRTGYLSGGRPVSVTVRTLYELANEVMSPSYHSLQPIDLDAKEGREFQSDMIASIVRSNRLRYILKYEEGLSEKFKEGMLSDVPEKFKGLIERINLEFQLVLDCEGIRSGTAGGDNYVAGAQPYLTRGGWSERERALILEVYSAYKGELYKGHLISVDQLIADYYRYLGSHAWDALRSREGFDVVYIDETHLFNPLEQMIFPYLFREGRSERAGQQGYPLFVAYDLKQANKVDTSTGTSSIDKLLRNGASGSDLVSLEQVFRFTKEIAAFVEGVVFETGAFRHLDVADQAVGDAKGGQGDLPTVVLYQSDLSLYNSVFLEAARISAAKGGGGKVAVVCFNARKYNVYAAAGNYKEKFITIESKDDLNSIRYCGKRFIYSEPSYLAGHQFDVVFVVNVDEGVFSDEDNSPLVKAELITKLYLAMTRAKSRLVICSSKDGGGIPAFLKNVASTALAELKEA